MAIEDPTPNPNPDDKDIAYWQAEAKKAFLERDAAKKAAKELAGKTLSDEQIAKYKELEDAAAKAEDERKRKAGEWDSLRDNLTKKHAQDIAERDAKIKAADEKYQRTMIGLAFAGATDVFGKDSLTIYSAKAGERIFGDYVTLDETGTAIVKDRHGDVILDATTGKPASFSAAMKELIDGLPDKADHLRGSGKAGSGSPGGSNTPATQADVAELTRRAQTGDKAAIDALRARRNTSAGRLVLGSALSR